jgi:hypothetical protein
MVSHGPALPVLDYSSRELERSPSRPDPVLLPFASGAFLPFAVLALLVHDTGLISIGFCVAWGEAGALLLALKMRRRSIRRPRQKGRPWWISVLVGAANSVAVAGSVKLTTARDPFWPPLGQGGSILLAFGLAGVVAMIFAVILAPRA